MNFSLKNKIKKIEEGLDLEIYLVDDIIEEITEYNSDLINEGMLDLLKKFTNLGWNIIKGGAVDVVLGKYDKSYGNSFSKLFKDAGKKPGDQIDPNKSADDLLIWAGSQGHVLECVEFLVNLPELLKKLDSPIPDPEDQVSVRKWSKKGEFNELAKNISKEYVSRIIASARTISQKKPKIKEFEETMEQIMDLVKNKGLVGGLKSIKIFCDKISSGSWAKAMKGAKKASKKRKWFEEKGNNLDAIEAISMASSVSSLLSSEIDRLEKEEERIRSKAGGQGEKETEDKGEDKSPVKDVF